MTGSSRQGPWDPLSEEDPAEHSLSVRSLYVLLVVLLSGWVLGAALRLSSVGRIRLQSTSSVSMRTNQSFSSANLFSMRRRVSATCRRCAHNSPTNFASRSR